MLPKDMKFLPSANKDLLSFAQFMFWNDFSRLKKIKKINGK